LILPDVFHCHHFKKLYNLVRFKFYTIRVLFSGFFSGKQSAPNIQKQVKTWCVIKIKRIMKTQKTPKRQFSKEYHSSTHSDNNTGTLGREGGLPNRREQKPFEPQDKIEDLVTGNEEYDRHHKPERLHKQIKSVSAEDERKKGEINPDLPGNRPGNKMTTHAEDYGGESRE
jgi:hypothetical protein